jgi:hypothetical protein
VSEYQRIMKGRERLHWPRRRPKCAQCGPEPLSGEARFCSKCGKPVATLEPERPTSISIGRFIGASFTVLGRALAYPVKKRQERIRWLTEASGPGSPIENVSGLSEGAKRVYAYLARMTLRFGSAHSRTRMIAHDAGLSERTARNAITELERRGLLSRKRRQTWHARGANAYFVKPVETQPGQRG